MASPIVAVSNTSSNDFASVIDRSVTVASLHQMQVQQQRLTLNERNTPLSSLDTKVTAIKDALSAIGESVGPLSLQVKVSDEAAILPSVSGGASSASFAISIEELGSATTFVASGYPLISDPEAGSYIAHSTQTLTINKVPTTLSPASHTLQALVDEINGKAGTNVRATIVNVGSTSTSNFQLSLQSTRLGPFDISLGDGATITANTAPQRGISVEYTVDGEQVTSESRTITLAPNVIADLLKETTSPIVVTLTESAGALEIALSSFLTAYNDVVAEVNKHRGNRTAVFSGEDIIGKASASLRSLFNIPGGPGSFRALSDMGVGVDRSGKLSLDSPALTDIAAFFGAITSQKQQIAKQQNRIDRLQEDLQQRMEVADAVVVSLDQQETYFTGMYSK